jgi:diguanylate cyclase
MLLFPADPKQALRCRRLLMATAAYLMWMAVGVYLYFLGLLSIGPGVLAAYYACILLTNAILFVLVRSGLNRRFSDPSLTVLQLVVALSWALGISAMAAPEARGLLLLVFFSALFFGIFRLQTRDFLGLAAFASAGYAVLVVWNVQMHEMSLRLEILQWVVVTMVLIWMSFMGGYVARLRSNLRQAMGRIEELARVDALTGTDNRRSITQALEEAIRLSGDSGLPVAVCLLDLDFCKKINDAHGHLAGDHVLKELVVRVEGELRGTDLVGRDDLMQRVGRFGGEEFLVVLPETDENGAAACAERIRRKVGGRPFRSGGREIPVTVSVGVAQWLPGEGLEALLRRADEALYRAKRGGRNRVESAA